MRADDIRALAVAETAALVRTGELRARDVADAYLARAMDVDPTVGAFLALPAESIRAGAERLDARRAAGEMLGPLAGVPVAVKDNIATLGLATTCGSRVLQGHVPVRDATAVARLLLADALVFGKTNLDEFGMGSTTENSAFRTTRNPWALDHVPGGSSGGSAAALASGQALAALGSDTGGSVRQPAAFCGLVGLKPHYGRVSRSGLVAYASSLDVIGPMGRTSEDVALLLRAIEGPDPLDSTSLRDAPPTAPHRIADPVGGLRVGLPRELLDGVDPDVERCFEETAARLGDLGVAVEEVALPFVEHAVATYYVLADAEASSNLSRYDGIRFGRRAADAATLDDLYERTRGEGFGLEVKRRILLGTFVLSHGYYEAYYAQAQRVRAKMKEAVDTALRQVDAILLPASPRPAFRLGELCEDPLAMYLSDVFTLPANLVQNPAVCFPAGRAGPLPVGMQLLGGPCTEDLLLRLVHALERSGFPAKGAAARDPEAPRQGPLALGRERN